MMKKIYHSVLLKYQQEFDKVIKLEDIIQDLKRYFFPNNISIDSTYKYYKLYDCMDNSAFVIYIEYNEVQGIKFQTLDGKIYKNVTDCLIGKKFVAKIYKDVYDIKIFAKQLAVHEMKWRNEREKAFLKHNKQFNKNFKVFNGIYDIYDKDTGAIMFYDYEWELMPDSNLKSFFCEKKDLHDKYILHKDDSIILRGCWVYYYFPCVKKRLCNPTFEEVTIWSNRCSDFLNRSKDVISNFTIITKYEVRLLLGYLDNLRNIVMLMLNTSLLKHNNFSNFVYRLSSSPRVTDIEMWHCFISEIDDYIIQLCLKSDVSYKEVISSILHLVKEIGKLFQNNINDILGLNNENWMGYSFRVHRELDDFWENYIGLYYSCSELVKLYSKTNKKVINLIGIIYGGLELPLLAKKILSDTFNDINIVFYNFKGAYLDRHSSDNDTNFSLDNETKKLFKKDDINLILDDNIMTGSTIQIALNRFTANDVIIQKIILIRHPNINRIAQMDAYKKVADLTMFDKIILGALNPSPYSKIKLGTNYKNEYLDEIGVFTITGYVFLKYLYKNGLFTKQSEVDTIKGFIEGKERTHYDHKGSEEA